MNSRKTVALIFLVALIGTCIFLGYNFLMDRKSTSFNDSLYYLLGYYSEELQSAEMSWNEFEGIIDKVRDENEFDVRVIKLDFNRFEKMLEKDIEENGVRYLLYDLEAEKMWYAYPESPEEVEEAFFCIVSK